MAGSSLGATVTLDDLDRDPHPLLARLREHEPVARVPALGGWLVTRHDLAVAVMRDAATFTVDDPRFSTGQIIGPSMLSRDGAEHARHRTPFVPGFRPGAVRERFATATNEECDRLIEDLRPRGRAEILAELAGPLAARVLTRALGCEPGEAGTVRDWYEAIVAAVTALSSDGGDAATIARGETAYAQLAARLSIVIAEGDPGSLLAAAAHSAGDTLSAAELAANAAVILFGGIETTEGLIASSLLHVLSTPDGAAPLVGPDGQADAELVARAVEETLRLEPAAAMVDRYATVDTELGGAGIPAGDLVHVSLAAAGRDPAVFEDPDRFRLDPPRPARHLAFAQGPHVCLGVHLARLEARVALSRALERLPRLRADPAAPAAVRGVVFRKPPTLHVLWG